MAGDAVAWQGTSSTSGLRRRIDELAAYLFREDDFPAGVVLSTGTSLVPDLPFTLQAGDEIRIKISEIGELVNPVVRGKAAVAAAVHADASDKLTKDSHPTSSAAGSKVSAATPPAASGPRGHLKIMPESNDPRMARPGTAGATASAYHARCRSRYVVESWGQAALVPADLV